MYSDKTLVEAIKEYEQQGYKIEFKLTEKCLQDVGSGKEYDPQSFSIVGVHRFDGMTNIDDEAVLYVIEADEGKTKGLLIDAYGAYSDSLSFEMIQKLATHHNDSN
ncbi:MAG: phosphoribosylpyrophosphate synthetase [Crocinitomicaceae bacterium]|nr:phosphoribosylpyrophosphate synthetase [Crocinitomicaceae bacterium]